MADNLLKEEELFAWQIDFFDNEANRIRNNRKRKQRATDFTVQLRIETENTNGWLHLQSQITVGRKPSQTKRSIKTQVDLSMFNDLVAIREEEALEAKDGFDIQPVISSFYKKDCKFEGMIPSFYCMFMKKKNENFNILLALGEFVEWIPLDLKVSDTHTIYNAERRIKMQSGFVRKGY